MNLYTKISMVQSTNPHFSKDLQKAVNATCFIGRGSLASSTHKYMTAAGELANKGTYSSVDVVFISAEGNRKGRIPVDCDELLKAIKGNATIITDDAYNRHRPYNIGEREVESFLLNNGYEDTSGKGIWKPKTF